MMIRQQTLEKKLRSLQMQQAILILTTANFFKQKSTLMNEKATLEAKLLSQIVEFTQQMEVVLVECKALVDGAPAKLSSLVENHKKNQSEIKNALQLCTQRLEDLLHQEEKHIAESKNQLDHITTEKKRCLKQYLFTVFYQQSKKEIKPDSPETMEAFSQLKKLIMDQEAARLINSPDFAVRQLGADILTQFHLIVSRFMEKKGIKHSASASEALQAAIADKNSPLSLLLQRPETLVTTRWLLAVKKETAYDRVLCFFKTNLIKNNSLI